MFGSHAGCVRTPFPNSVPQGRLNLAELSPGRQSWVHLKVVQDCVAGLFSAVPAGLVVVSNPTQD